LRRSTARSAGSPSRRLSRSWALYSSAANPDGAISKSEGSHAATACVQSSGRSRKRCDNECTGRSLKPGNGLRKSSPGISPTTPCRPIARRLLHSTTTSSTSGSGNYVGAARGRGWSGRRWRNSPTSSSQSRGSSTLGRACALPSDTQGRSRVPELGSLGSVRGALSNGRPYRELVI
jgi:hypothetical protein